MRDRLLTVAGNLMLKFMPHYLHVDENTTLEDYRKFMLPVDSASARVAAGIFLKMSMSEMLFAAHRENALEGFPEYRWGSRRELYQALDKVTFEDYACRILAPFYPDKSVDELLNESSLRAIENTLRNSPKIRVFHNIDDFLLDPEEKVWLDGVLKERLTWFSNGGHLGNLYYKVVLRAIVAAADTSVETNGNGR
jgi:hypothetical protein